MIEKHEDPKAKKAQTIAQGIAQREITFVAEPGEKKHQLLALLQRIPLLIGLLQSVNGIGASSIKLIEVGHEVTPLLKDTNFNLQVFGIVIAFIDFIRIPLIYLASYLLGQEVPFTLTKNAKLLYAGTLLAIGIIGLTVPGAASLMVLLSSALGFGMSLATLGRHIYSAYSLTKRLEKLPIEISEKLQELKDSKKNINKLLLEIKSNGTPENLLPQKLESLKEESKTYYDLEEDIQNLYDKQLKYSEKLQKLRGVSLIDKAVGFSIAILVLAGVATAGFFPLIGISVITAAASIAILYVAARVFSVSLAKFFTKIGITAPTDAKDDGAVNTNTAKPDYSLREKEGVNHSQDELEQKDEKMCGIVKHVVPKPLPNYGLRMFRDPPPDKTSVTAPQEKLKHRVH